MAAAGRWLLGLAVGGGRALDKVAVAAFFRPLKLLPDGEIRHYALSGRSEIFEGAHLQRSCCAKASLHDTEFRKGPTLHKSRSAKTAFRKHSAQEPSFFRWPAFFEY